MNRRIEEKHSRSVVLAMVTLYLLAGCRQNSPSSGAEDSKSIPPVPVRCAKAQVTTLRPSIELVGTILSIPDQTVVLSTQVAGQIQSLSVVESQAVHAGEELLRLDARTAESNRVKLRAAVDENRAIVARLKQGTRPEEIDSARQEVVRAESNLRLVREKLESARKLHETQAIPDLEFSQRKSAVEDAEAQLASMKARLKLLEAGPRPEEISEAESKLAGAEADFAAGELALQLMRVTAPIDGYVTDLPVRQGMYVTAGTTLLTLTDQTTVFARTRVPTAYLAQVTLGAPVDVRVPAFAHKEFSGKISRIGRQADMQTGDVDAWATVPNPLGELRSGLSCRLRIWLPEIRDALAIPVASIADRDGTPVVTVIRDGKAYEVEVLLAGRTNELVQVIKGLSTGDLVATEGGYGLPEGCPCKVQMVPSTMPGSAAPQPG